MQSIDYTKWKIIRAIHHIHIWLKGLFSWNDFERPEKKKKCTKCNCDNEGPILVDICRKNLMVNSCLIQTKKNIRENTTLPNYFRWTLRFRSKNSFSFHTNDPRKWILHWRSMHVEMTRRIGIANSIDLMEVT
jgi:hypothetical protein